MIQKSVCPKCFLFWVVPAVGQLQCRQQEQLTDRLSSRHFGTPKALDQFMLAVWEGNGNSCGLLNKIDGEKEIEKRGSFPKSREGWRLAYSLAAASGKVPKSHLECRDHGAVRLNVCKLGQAALQHKPGRTRDRLDAPNAQDRVMRALPLWVCRGQSLVVLLWLLVQTSPFCSNQETRKIRSSPSLLMEIIKVCEIVSIGTASFMLMEWGSWPCDEAQEEEPLVLTLTLITTENLEILSSTGVLLTTTLPRSLWVKSTWPLVFRSFSFSNLFLIMCRNNPRRAGTDISKHLITKDLWLHRHDKYSIKFCTVGYICWYFVLSDVESFLVKNESF